MNFPSILHFVEYHEHDTVTMLRFMIALLFERRVVIFSHRHSSPSTSNVNIQENAETEVAFKRLCTIRFVSTYKSIP